ncbi:hypothetical protein L0B53_00160 [Vibrio sp. SS-MA-C1-2]|uniref:hypothetical protein n=1 Tax=Vibrio sp. SS-MA-C1-2 TaxID=2908646 RepID=UPI001F188D97|nr:hypothetical protein [Vibrio sp. SS-MA-C1-2]UJF17225.1 hypothetical protein L0B53_00160 [Vibrio sp. SS-MA-C1-2]
MSNPLLPLRIFKNSSFALPMQLSNNSPVAAKSVTEIDLSYCMEEACDAGLTSVFYCMKSVIQLFKSNNGELDGSTFVRRSLLRGKVNLVQFATFSLTSESGDNTMRRTYD